MQVFRRDSGAGGGSARFRRGRSQLPALVLCVLVSGAGFALGPSGHAPTTTQGVTVPDCWRKLPLYLVPRPGAPLEETNALDLARSHSERGRAVMAALLDATQDLPDAAAPSFVEGLAQPVYVQREGKLVPTEQREFVFHLWDDELFHAEVASFQARLRGEVYAFTQSPPLGAADRKRVGEQVEDILALIGRLSREAGYDAHAAAGAIEDARQSLLLLNAPVRWGTVLRPLTQDGFRRVETQVTQAFASQSQVHKGSVNDQRRFVTEQVRRLTQEFTWRPPSLRREPGSRYGQLMQELVAAKKREADLLARAQRQTATRSSTAPTSRPATPNSP